MTDSIADILGSNKFREPPEIRLIKDFVLQAVDITPGVSLRDDLIIIRMPNASAAGALRFQINNLKKELNTTKRLVIKIGS